MTSNRPYLIRAIHEWIEANQLTPHVLVDCTRDDVQVPSEHVQDGRIVLNLSHSAVNGLQLGNELIRFDARFGGNGMSVIFPPSAVIAIYARENGQGMLFSEGSNDDGPPTPEPPDSKRAHLKVVK